MSARELIEKVAALPPHERTLFLRLLEDVTNGSRPAAAGTTARPWPDFRERLHHIYGNKIAPDSQDVIDEGRGDR